MSDTTKDFTMAEFRALKALAAGLVAAQLGGAGGGASAGAAAPDSELDHEYGNPTVRKDPKKWTGKSYVGCTFSQCPVEYLETLAGFLDWKATKEDEEGKTKYAGYSRKDAARARGWIRRIKAGWKPAQQAAPQDYGDSYEDPGLDGFGAEDPPF